LAGGVSVPALMTRSPRVEGLPAVRGLVPRRPLFDRLSRVGPREVVLLCAPARFRLSQLPDRARLPTAPRCT
ncbi:MAG: hypothetical protein ABW221_05110, partial [Vicinamibacteria bacterium]